MNMRQLLVMVFTLVSIVGFSSACSHGSRHGGHHKSCDHKGKKGEACPMKKHHAHHDMSVEDHKAMAQAHTEVAECLESGKSKEECRKIMKEKFHKKTKKESSDAKTKSEETKKTEENKDSAE